MGTPVPPSSTGWTLVEDNCHVNSSIWTSTEGANFGGVARTARGLEDILNLFLEECGLTVQSNFFNINPDASNPLNEAYTYAAQFCQDVRIDQITNIKRPDADQPATTALLSLKQLIETLKYMFNVDYTIVGSLFILEHESYFQTFDYRSDLTVDKFKPYITGFYKYTYDKLKLPASESFLWGEEWRGLDDDFQGLPIQYEEPCSYEDEGKDEEYITRKFVTSLEFIRENTEYFDSLAEDEEPEVGREEVSNDLLVILSTEGGVILNDTGAITGELRQNGAFSWANLHSYFHKIGRPHESGMMNGVQTDFITYNRPRIQEPFSIPICCENFLDLNPDFDLFKTQLGYGRINEASLIEPTGKLTLTLEYKA